MTSSHIDQDTRLSADVVVIGGGPVGENAAQYAIDGTDLTAIIVEGHLVGGECSYYACMPSKALLRPVTVAGASADIDGLSPAHLDREAMLERRDVFVSRYDDSSQVEWAESAGIQVVRGHGRLVGERTVEVDSDSASRTITARHAVIVATGSEAVVPDQYSGLSAWTSRDATGVVEVPKRLAIVGGGVVACEAATWMRALGAQVTMLVRGTELLGGHEPFAGETVKSGLESQGVRVILQAQVTQCRRENPEDTGLGKIHGGIVRATISGTDHEFDEILLATGRVPRLRDVGLASVDLTPDMVQDGDLPRWLYAVGDANGEAPLTHWGKYRARVVGAAIQAEAAGSERPFEPEAVPVPQVVFTEPQVALVGLTESAARDQGVDVVTAQVPFNAAAGSALMQNTVPGQVKFVVDRHTRCLVGATFAGPEAGELLHAATIAIVGQVPVHVLRHAVASYPTASELWLRLLESMPEELHRPA